jgi:hypothetical protein
MVVCSLLLMALTGMYTRSGIHQNGLSVSRHTIKKRKIRPQGLSRRTRMKVGILSLILVVSGALSLMAGHLHYPNYWGGMVFAPFAVLVGAVAILGMIFMRRG